MFVLVAFLTCCLSIGSSLRLPRSHTTRSLDNAMCAFVAPIVRNIPLSDSSAKDSSTSSTLHRALDLRSAVIFGPEDSKRRKGALLREWELPLNGERIMYTTPRQFAAKLSSVLVEAGANPMWCPSVRFSPLLETSPLSVEFDMLLQKLKQFDIIAFTSRYGIDSFCDRMEAIYGGVPGALRELEKSKLKVVALTTNVDVLRERFGITPALIAPDEIRLAEALGGRAGASVLLPSPIFENITEPQVVNQVYSTICARGVSAVRAPAYLIRPGNVRAHQPELSALAQGSVDVVGLTSALEVQGLLQMLGGTWDSLPPTTSIVANGIDTATQAKALGLSTICLSSKAESGDAFVAALADYCTERKGLRIWTEF